MQKFIDHMRAAGQTDEMIAESLIDAGNNKLAVLNMLGVSSVEELNDRSMNGISSFEHGNTRGSVRPIVDNEGNIAFKIVPVSTNETPETPAETSNAAAPVIQDEAAKTSPIRPVTNTLRSTGIHNGLRSSSRYRRSAEKVPVIIQRPQVVSPTQPNEPEQAHIPEIKVPDFMPTIEELEQNVQAESTDVPENSGIATDRSEVPEKADANNNEHEMVAPRHPVPALSIHGLLKPPVREFNVDPPAENSQPETPSGVDSTETEQFVLAEEAHDHADLSPFDETMHLLSEHKELDPEYSDDATEVPNETIVEPSIPADDVARNHAPETLRPQDPSKASEEMMDLEPIKRLEPIKMPVRPMPRPPIEQVPLPQEIEVTELEAIDGPAHNLQQVARDAEKEMEDLNGTMPYAIPDSPEISKLGDAARTIRESNGLKTALILVLVLSLLILAASIGYRIYYVGL